MNIRKRLNILYGEALACSHVRNEDISLHRQQCVDKALNQIKDLIISELEGMKDKTDEFDLPIEDSWTNYGLAQAIKKVGEL